MARRLEETEQEKQLLQRENEEIMEELFRARTAASMDFTRIERLAHQIGALAHSRDCCCAGETRDASN